MLNKKCKPFQTMLYKYNLLKNSNIPYNLSFTTKFNDSSIYFDYFMGLFELVVCE